MPLMCPLCSSPMSWYSVRWGRAFLCPSCEGKIQVPPRYETTLGILALVLNAYLVYALGTRGVWMVISFAALYLPLNWVVLVVAAILLPPGLEATGGTSLLERD